MKLARVFTDGMVLQRRMPIYIWGTCEEAQTVAVRLNGKEICTAGLQPGEFTLLLPAQEAMEDVLLQIGEISLSHVDIGEVWVAGGQSNMEFMLQYDRDGEAEIASARDSHLRTYTVGQYSFPGEREMGYKAWNPWDKWVPFTAEHAKELPAVAIYFAKELRKQGIPVGILNCSWGGTTASAWMDRELLAADPELKVYTDEFDALVASLDPERFQQIRSIVRPAMASQDSQKMMGMILKNTFHPAKLQKAMMKASPGERQQVPQPAPQLPGGIDLTQLSQAELMQEGPGDKLEPGSLYTNMVKEIEGFSTRGVIWYQGESDEGKAPLYDKLLGTMIECWRRGWQSRNSAQEKLPFLFAQIAPYGTWMNNTSENYPELRRRQQMAADTVPDAYMASTSDVGNVYDIHPKEKQPVGHRLALLARKYIYGETELLADAPRAWDAKKSGDTLMIRFHHGEGLHLRAQSMDCYNGFALSDISPELIPPVLGGVCGLEILADGKPVTDGACAAEGECLLVRSSQLIAAKDVQICFAQTPFYRVNLFNEADIPALPFQLKAK